MPNDMPPPTDVAARVNALRDRLDEIGKSLETLQAERTAVTRELAAMWVDLDLHDIPSSPEAEAEAEADAAPAKPAPKKTKTAARSPKSKRKS